MGTEQVSGIGQLFADGQSVGIGQAEVEHDRRERFRLGPGQPRGPRIGRHRVHSLSLEPVTENIRERVVIVDNQHAVLPIGHSGRRLRLLESRKSGGHGSYRKA